MGNFIATRVHIYVAGAVILAANHNDNEDEIFDKHNDAFNATTGHGHTGATGDGPKLTSSGINLASNFAWTGNHSFTTGTFTLNNGGALAGTFTGTPTFNGNVVFSANPNFSGAPTLSNFTNANHDHLDADDGGALDAAAITSGTFADARISQSSVTQHQTALALATSQVTSGTFADARISQSSVTQYQANLAIASTQLTYSGLTSGHVLQATGAATAVFQALTGIAASAITSGTFADARISQSSVTQHQAALSIASSQLTGVTGTGNAVLATSATLTTATLQNPNFRASTTNPINIQLDDGTAVTQQIHITLDFAAGGPAQTVDFYAGSTNGLVTGIFFINEFQTTTPGGACLNGTSILTCGMGNNISDHSTQTGSGTVTAVTVTSPGAGILRLSFTNASGVTYSYRIVAYVSRYSF